MTIGIRDRTFSSEDTLMALFARMDSVAMSVALAISLALGLATATAALLLTANPGTPVGPNLSALGNILPGYSVTWAGSVIGAAWAALIGSILGFLIAACWNFTHVVLVGLVALLYAPSHPAPKHGGASIAIPAAPSVDQKLISSVVRLNVVISAVGTGLGLGLFLLLATFVSLTVSNYPGRYLNLLAVFMPGYSATISGAWFGLLWGIVYGAISGGLVAWLYGRTLGAKLPEMVLWDANAIRRLRPPVLRISGYALGPALGLVAGLQLFLATTWLVVRGTAHESVHAQLLSNYVPHYTVSLQGGLIGGFELLLLVSLGSAFATTIYDYVAYSRHTEQPTSLSQSM
jgi:hypothetical protein